MRNGTIKRDSDLGLPSLGGLRTSWVPRFSWKASWVAGAGSPFSWSAWSAPRRQPDPQSQSSPARPRLLLVEDDPVSAKSLQFILNGHGFEVVLASTLAEARPLLRTSPTHVLIDLMLPDGDGATLLQTIRDEKLPIWAGVITGVSDPDRIDALKPLNPGFLLRKPIDLDVLLRALK